MTADRRARGHSPDRGPRPALFPAGHRLRNPFVRTFCRFGDAHSDQKCAQTGLVGDRTARECGYFFLLFLAFKVFSSTGALPDAASAR